jgi:bacteriocin biosynthesis cyclodehydratase domain-containing protein
LSEEVIHPEDRDFREADPVRVGLLQGHLTAGSVPPAPAGGARYRLRPSVEAFVDRHGVLCFVRPGSMDLIVRDPDPEDIALVQRLQTGWLTADSVAGGEARLQSLIAADLVLVRDAAPAEPLPAEDAERFSRQLPYLAELGDEVALQRRVREATVAVVGCGGLGTWAVAALACLGVGRLVLVDDDTVSLSNLNRQILYARADVGGLKTAVTERWLRAFDPAVRVTRSERRVGSAAEVAAVVAGADAVVLAADWPPYEIGRWVNEACVQARIPFIVAGQLPPVIKVGPTYFPGRGACLDCHEAALRRDSYAFDDYVAFREADPGVASTIGPASCVAGGLIGLELLHLLSGRTPATQGCAALLHMQTLELRHLPVERDPSCPTCKHLE